MLHQQAPTDMFELQDYEDAIDRYIEMWEIDNQVLDEDFICFWIFFFTAYSLVHLKFYGFNQTFE